MTPAISRRDFFMDQDLKAVSARAQRAHRPLCKTMQMNQCSCRKTESGLPGLKPTLCPLFLVFGGFLFGLLGLLGFLEGNHLAGGAGAFSQRVFQVDGPVMF